MTILTLTGHLGSMGTIAREVATRLGYALADRELLLEAAQALGWSEADVAAFDERTRGQGSRLANFLRDWARYMPVDEMDASGLGTFAASSYRDSASVEEMRPRDRRYIAVLSDLVLQLAERGDAVIVGRGGQALLAGRDDVVHVHIICDIEERIRRIATRDGMSDPAARLRVEDSDKQRAAWHRKYFDVDYESPYLYHMALNVTALPDALASDLVVRLAQGMAAPDVRRAHLLQGATAPEAEPAVTQGRQDWGWIELVGGQPDDLQARGHLFATRVAPDGAWQGQLESIHLHPGIPMLHPGKYFARFALSGTDHAVRLEVTEHGTRLHSTDVEVPAIFRERSGG